MGELAANYSFLASTVTLCRAPPSPSPSASPLHLDDAVRIAHEAERMMTGGEYSVASQQVLQLAAQSGCSAYDCEFVGLAQDLGVTFVTADRQILAAFPSVAVSPESFVARR